MNILMKRIALYLHPKQISAVKQCARKKGLKPAEIIRRAIDEFIARQK